MSFDFSTLPPEVGEGLQWYLKPDLARVTHVHLVPKTDNYRGGAWDQRPRVANQGDRNPWEKCHTEHFWCWFVLGPRSLR